MPRTNVRNPSSRPYKNYSLDDLEKALEDLKQDESLRNTAKKFKIPVMTLSNKKRSLHEKKVGRPTVLNEEEENAIVAGITCMAEWGFPVDQDILKRIIRDYFCGLGIKIKRFKDGIPGPDFVRGFLNRHKDKLRIRTVTNYSRKRASVDSNILNAYFDNLEKSLAGIPSENIFNYDETNLTDNPGKKKCITKKGAKYPIRIMNESKAAISLMVCANAAGELLPPFVCYKAKGLFGTWLYGGPKGARYSCSKSGWFESNTFEEWFYSLALPFLNKKEGTKVLIGDNLSSHFSVKVIETCRKDNIKFICLPPNATDYLQPLDVAFFAPFKRHWRALLDKYKLDNPNESAVKKDKFPQLLNMLWENILPNSSKNLQNGFQRCLSRKEILADKRFESAEQVNQVVNQVLLDVLREKRFGKNLKTVRRTRITVPAGKSVCDMEDEDDNNSGIDEETAISEDGPSEENDTAQETSINE